MFYLKIDFCSSHKKEAATSEVKEDTKIVSPLRKELVFGLNSILRKIRNNKVIGVALTHPLTIHVQEVLNDLCTKFNIPFLIIPGLDKLEKILNISSVTCLAFTSKVIETESICNQIFELFKKHATQISEDSDKVNNLNQSDVVDNSVNSSEDKKQEPLFQFDIPSLNELYTYIKDDNQPKSSFVSQSNVLIETNSSLTEEAFIAIDKSSDNLYFPDRPYFQKEIKINLNFNRSLNAYNVEDKKFAHTLLNSSSSQPNFKLDTHSSYTKYQEPKLVYLEASKKRKLKNSSKNAKKNKKL